MKPQTTLAHAHHPPRHVEIRGATGTRPLRLHWQDEDSTPTLITKDQQRLAWLIARGIDHTHAEPEPDDASGAMLIASCKGGAEVLVDGQHVLLEHALRHIAVGAWHAIEVGLATAESCERPHQRTHARWRSHLDEAEIHPMEGDNTQLLQEAVACVALALSGVALTEEGERSESLDVAADAIRRVRRRLDPRHVSRRRPDLAESDTARLQREGITWILRALAFLDEGPQITQTRELAAGCLRGAEAQLRTVWKVEQGVPRSRKRS